MANDLASPDRQLRHPFCAERAVTEVSSDPRAGQRPPCRWEHEIRGTRSAEAVR
jgi:hypothetical protein